MSAEASPKETVILVHGTWAAPTDGKLQWYQRIDGPEAEQSFVAKLDDALARHGSSARCWKHGYDNKGRFTCWTGKNTWLERCEAAASLAEELKLLTTTGCRPHVVAHSHGGNILVEALPHVVWSMKSDNHAELGKMVTLGTPFIDTLTALRKRRRSVRKLFAASALIISLLTIVLLGASVVPGIAKSGLQNWLSQEPFSNIGSGCVLVLLTLVTTLGIVRYLRWGIPDPSWASLAGHPSFPRPILAINSSSDEALIALRNLAGHPNPIEPGVGPLQYLFTRYKEFIEGQTSIAKRLRIVHFGGAGLLVRLSTFGAYAVVALLVWLLAGAPGGSAIGLTEMGAQRFALVSSPLILVIAYYMHDFMALFATPFRWLRWHLTFLMLIPQELGTFVVKRRGWRVLQRIGLGLEQYPHACPEISECPAYLRDAIKYEELRPEWVTRAKIRRKEGGGKAVTSLGEFLATRDVTVDILGHLTEIANDLSLVHAAYYTDDECIDRIARWIAGKG